MRTADHSARHATEWTWDLVRITSATPSDLRQTNGILVYLEALASKFGEETRLNTTRFDNLALMLAKESTRRGTLRPLVGGLMAGLFARRAAEPAAAEFGLTCAPGREWCYDICADPRTDRNNCGSCGHVCEFYETCSNGACVALAILPAPTWPAGPPLDPFPEP